MQAPVIEAPTGVADPVPARPAVRSQPTSRMPLYAGFAVMAVIGIAAAAWVLMRPEPATAPAAPVPEAVPEAMPALPLPEATVPAGSVETLPRVQTNPAEPDPEVVTRTRPVTPSVRSVAPATASPAPAVRVQVQPQPRPAAPAIVVAPLDPLPAGPPPTVAQPSQTDPDAPILTRPQPLDQADLSVR
ncbi:MAG: hypothetical protein DCE92_06355 [Alphaproteobacteria bacterium]|nr:MAG: hypothetical protein DCE92_06355 [Alphaproteobacteria bacterium]